MESDEVTLHADTDEFKEPPDSKPELENALSKTQARAYTKGTIKNLLSQWKALARFCKKYDIDEWPLKEHTVCLFAQYLAYSFHSARSVRNYINGVKLYTI